MQKHWKWILPVCGVVLLIVAALCWHLIYPRVAKYGFSREVSLAERDERMRIVRQAESWLGTREGDAAHGSILSIYNTHTPLAQGYEVTEQDNWCAAFGSVVAIRCGMTDIIPTECGCQRQIGLFEQMGCWVEDDGYTPLPGDYIFYCWKDVGLGDSTGWSNHVGIVAGTAGGYIKVIEGNYKDAVAIRYIPIDGAGIRGFGVPDYGKG